MSRATSTTGALVRAAGLLLVGASVVFVAVRIHSSWRPLAGWRPTPSLLAAIVFGALLYAAASTLLAEAWHGWLRLFAEEPPARLASHQTYARTQIAKYLPGNLFHLAGRHLEGRRQGTLHGPLAAAALYEILGLLFGASAAALLGLGLFGLEVPGLPALALAAIGAATLLAPLLLAALAGSSRCDRLRLRRLTRRELLVRVAANHALYALFFTAGGAAFLAVAAAGAGLVAWPAAGAIVVLFPASWIAGYLTPGAPAGMGVREAVLMLGLDGVVGAPASIVIPLAFRVATVSGDLLYFASSLWPSRPARR